jgi:hypothetical protein
MAGSELDGRDAARALAPLALETLAEIMRGGGTDTARLAAAKEVLDRALGKSRAAEAEPAASEGLTVVIRKFAEDDEDEPAET